MSTFLTILVIYLSGGSLFVGLVECILNMLALKLQRVFIIFFPQKADVKILELRNARKCVVSSLGKFNLF